MSPKILETLREFADGPAIRGHRKSSDWNIKHEKTKTYNGKKYKVVWIFPATSKKIDSFGFLKSVNGGIVYELTDAGRDILAKNGYSNE